MPDTIEEDWEITDGELSYFCNDPAEAMWLVRRLNEGVQNDPISECDTCGRAMPVSKTVSCECGATLCPECICEECENARPD